MKTKRALCIIGLLAISLLYGCGIPKETYYGLVDDLETTKSSLTQATGDLETTKASLAQTTSDLEITKASLAQTTSDLEITKASLGEWRHKYEIANAKFEEALAIAEDTLALADELAARNAELAATTQDLRGELGIALTPPYASIAARELSLVFYLLDGSIANWTLDVDTYRNWIQRPDSTATVTLNTVNGPIVSVDFTKFVKPSTFEDVVTGVYENSEDEWEFAKEAFNIATQLTVYSEDIGEDPRWPVETFVEGGGDCEDLSILYATILKASPYPYEVKLVYMDSDNPTDPQTINHIMVSVATNDWSILSECTNDEGFEYYESVVGWFFDV